MSGVGGGEGRPVISREGRNRGGWLAFGLVVALAVAGIAPPAEAAVGDVLWTVNIPAGGVGTVGAQCTGGSSGSAVAVVPGGKLNFPRFQSLLVTSCVESGQAKLFFLDPSTNPATLVTTLNTILPTGVTLDAGWESLALRPDKVDLVGCGLVGGSPKIYSIDFNKITPNTTVDGTATLLFQGPAGSTCQGLAWDVTSNPKTIYQSSSGTSPNVLHLSDTGGSIAGSVPSGCAGPTTGVAVGMVSAEAPAFSGSVLFVACPDAMTPEIRQIKRADGTAVTSVELPTGSFDLPTPLPGDVECDPVTFALSQSWHPTIRNKDVLWVKDTDPLNPHQVHAMELPFAACGPVPPPPTPAANACPISISTRRGRPPGLLGRWHVVGRWPSRNRPRRRLYTGADSHINKPLHAMRGGERNQWISAHRVRRPAQEGHLRRDRLHGVPPAQSGRRERCGHRFRGRPRVCCNLREV